MHPVPWLIFVYPIVIEYQPWLLLSLTGYNHGRCVPLGQLAIEKGKSSESILFTSLFWLHSQAVLSLFPFSFPHYYNLLSLLDYCSICNENPTVVIFAPETIAMQASLITFLPFLLLDYQKFR
ncbi:uncharacterized protein SEPMUDRAFT_152167 [Sphaerulina musiva SO2202]|uniref:Uncharacterized protein n=1 Tax=Sphaerulina musiva (strain SO2202) TaxID=692275 RepID=M3C9M3_SPHMS|nr:uncharacterized protein SEPMUDRAFT_152167 [Sphaerulina musiva SO2202]EMF08530.1 hypothetical protein SEPMUDRAFT_152167 [Sphaerulina musiva SO2202]